MALTIENKALSLKQAKELIQEPLTALVNSEATTRAQADSQLQGMISTETAARERTDFKLDMLWKLSQGIIASEVESASTDYEKPISYPGTAGFWLNEIGGKTRKGYNLIPEPYSFTVNGNPFTSDGLTFSYDGKGNITVKGTKTGTTRTAVTIVGVVGNSIDIPISTDKSYSLQINTIGTFSGDSRPTFEFRDSTSSGTTIIAYKGIEAYSKTDVGTLSNTEHLYIRGYFPAGFSTDGYTFNIMLEEGSTIHNFEPYFAGLKFADVESVDVRGKNLNNGSPVVSSTSTGYINASSGVFGNVEKGKTYTFSIEASVDIGGPNTMIRVNDGTTWVSINYLGTQSLLKGQRKSLAFTAPASGYIGLSSSGLTPSVEIFHNVQLEEGSTASAYSPYSLESRPIPEAVKALPGYGLGISDTVRNYVDYKNKQYVQMVADVRLADLTWFSSMWGTTGTTSFGSTSLGQTIKQVGNDVVSAMVSDRYNPASRNVLYGTKGDLIGTSGSGANFTLTVRDTRFETSTTVSEFVAALGDEILVYELAEPVPTDISDILAGFDNGFVCEAGGSITFAQDDVIKTPVPNKETFVVKTAEAI